MKILRSAHLWFKEGTSDKVYEVDLVDLETAQDNRYLVNFRYGRRGATLRDGTKTPAPVLLAVAEKLFDSVVVSKVNDGYRRVEDYAVAAAGDSSESSGRDARLLASLAACLRGSSRISRKASERLFWRLGVIRLEAAFPQLVALTTKLTPAAVSYSMVHALARCGCGEAVELLSAIAATNTSLIVRDYAAYALTSDLMGESRQPPQGALPQAFAAERARQIDIAVTAGNGAELIQLLLDANAEQPGFASQYLIALAHWGHSRPELRHAVLAGLQHAPARPPFVQALRRLFKYADLTDDGPLYAATARQFELATPMYRVAYHRHGDRIWLADSRETVKLSAELRGASPRIALSDQTLLYFKRRAWRMLRKRGELGQNAFTAMAGELLLAFSDKDGAGPRAWREYHRVDGRYQQVECSCDIFGRVWSASHVLHREAATSEFSSGSLSHRHVGGVSASQRGEAFPALWDVQPELLLRIAAEARNRPAAHFAVEALKQGSARPLEMEAAAVQRLLASPYQEVGDFALTIARRVIGAGQAEAGLVIGLIGATSLEAQRLGLEAIAQRADWPWADEGLALAVITSRYETIQQQVRTWLKEREPGFATRSRLTENLAAWLERSPAMPDEERRAGMRFALSLLPLLWPGHDCPLAPQTIEKLTGHPSPEIQAASIQLLAVTPIAPDQLPLPFWKAILHSSAPEIRAASMSLLSRLDSEALGQQWDVVVQAATSEYAELRSAARPLVTRIVAQDSDLAGRLDDLLMTMLFHAEPSEGHAADMVRLFVEALPQAFAAIDTGTLWRLLQAKAKGARLLGTEALQASRAPGLSVRQIARLGNHPHAAVRRWALAAFEADEARFRADPDGAVLFVESQWDDVRSVMVSRFMAWPADTLSATALALMADSVVPAVQEGARQLLRHQLAHEDVGTVLLRVLEHPSSSFHLFVTELLTGEGLEDDAVFAKFLLQARFILMRINGGRIAKERVFAALRREAMARRDRAEAIWRLVHELSLSITARDKAAALMILRDIGQSWPEIALPIGLAPALPRLGRPSANSEPRGVA